MKSLLIKNAAAILPDETTNRSALLIENGLIRAVSSSAENFKADEEIDVAGLRLFAGFIDIHNHGAVGVDVNAASAEDLHKASEFLAANGVTAWLPTLVPDTVENYRKAIEAIDELMKSQDECARSKNIKPSARILGVHYEGVFANARMCGALRPEFFRTFKDGDELNNLPKLAMPGAVHLTTLAPEIENGIALVKELKKQNWTISIGHTRADSKTLDESFAAGASSVTHLFNAMTGVHHRDLGVAGWALTNEKIACEIIADGVHVAPEMLRLAYKSKGAEKLALVSDSVAPTGLGDGEFELWGEKISVVNGKTQNERGSIAGSVITMNDAVKTMLSLGIEIEEVSKTASLAPARILGIERDYGSIEKDKRADFAVIDDEGNVKLCVVGGRIAFQG